MQEETQPNIYLRNLYMKNNLENQISNCERVISNLIRPKDKVKAREIVERVNSAKIKFINKSILQRNILKDGDLNAHGNTVLVKLW